METRASPFIVGLFTLGVLFGILLFVMWVGRYGDTTARETHEVTFTHEVTGLSPGSSVLYRGLRVGEVTGLTIPPDEPTTVVATISVAADQPIPSDVRAQIQTTGITGVSVLQLRGGSDEVATLRDIDRPIRIHSDPPQQIQTVIEQTQTMMVRLDSVVEQVEGLIAANQDSIATTVRNVETFTTALADSSTDVSTFLSDAGAAARRLDSVGARLETLTTHVDDIVTRIEPGSVQSIMADIESFAGRLDATSQRVAALIDDNEAAVASTIRNAETFTAALAENSDTISTFMADAGEAAQRLNSAGERIEALAGRADEILAAVEPEAVQTVMADMQSFAGRLDATSQQIAALIEDNEAAVASTIRNAETFTAALAENSDAISTFMADAGEAAQRLNSAGERIEVLAGRADEILQAVEPEAVQTVMADMQSFAGRLDSTSRQIALLVEENEEALSNTIRNAEAFSATLAENSDAITSFMADAGAAAQRLNSAGERIETLAGRADEILAAVEPETVRAVLADAQSFTARLDETSRRFDTLIAENETALTNTIRNAETFTSELTENSEVISQFLADASSAASRLDAAGERIAVLAGRADEVVAAVEPDAVRKFVTDAQSFADMLAANSDGIAQLTQDAGSAAARLNQIAGDLEGVGGDVSRMFAAIDPDKLARSLDNVDRFTTTLAGRSGDLDQFMDDAGAVAAQLRQSTGRFDEILQRVDGMLGEDGEGGFVTEVAAAARAFRQLSENLDERLAALTGDFQRLGGSSLREFQAFMSEGRRTLSNVERVITNLERDPSRLLFGGSQTPEYNPGRRF